MRPKIIAVDIDQTLTQEVCFTEDQCLSATPRQDLIDKVNDLYGSNFILIYTGRRIELSEATLLWLERCGVKYHAIKFEKTPYDLFIEQDSVRPDELTSGQLELTL